MATVHLNTCVHYYLSLKNSVLLLFVFVLHCIFLLPIIDKKLNWHPLFICIAKVLSASYEKQPLKF